MRYLILAVLPLLAFASTRPTLTFGRPRGGFLEAPSTDGFGYTWTEDKYMTYDNITQVVDHFNQTNKDTWKQRFQYNSKFYDSKQGLVFLMLGGEGSISPPGDKWVRNENVTMMTWAQEFKAAAFQLEHRFYGPKANSPYGDQSVKSLRYLTIDQALADIKEFIKQMNAKYFAGQNPRWVTFGGSYPGSLSAFFRETYPEMSIGAVSTSSAVHVFVDYYGYAVNTENTYRTVDPNCATAISKGFQSIISLAYGGVQGREQLKQKFSLCESFDESILSKSLQFFFSNVFGTFQGINQYTGDNRNNATMSGLGVPNACKLMVDATIGDEMARIKAVWDFYNSWYGAPACNSNNYTAFIQQYSDTSYTDIDDTVATRSWIWQTCTELGYFQTTDGGNNGIFGSIVPVDFYVDQCISMFGPEFSLLNTYNLVDKVRRQYGGDGNYKGTNVVFPNGSFDPWQSLGYLKSDYGSNIDAFMIDGTAHCADMYPASPNDKTSLIAARKRIHDNLSGWIQKSQNTQTTKAPQPAATSPKTNTAGSATLGLLLISMLTQWM